MKELLAVISLLVSGAVAEPPAPYPPSGWRPTGPAFELPQRGQQPQSQYLPVDPRNPQGPAPTPEEDVSVQGLPQQEQRPLFQASPISGQQYAGPAFNQDLRSLDESFQQLQYQQQQARYREYERQRQLELAQTTPKTSQPTPSNPRQFARTTEAPSTTQANSTTGFLNQGEVLNDEPEKTSVEVTKQNVKEFPGEFFLSSLAQLQLQPNFVPLQTVSGRYQTQPLYQRQPSDQSQKQTQVGYDGPAHFSALPSVLAQQQLALDQQKGFLQTEQPLLVQQPISQFAQAQVQTYQPQPQIQTQYQPDPVVLQAPAQFQPNVYIQPNPDAVAVQPTSQYAPAAQPQFIAQPVAFPPQQPNFSQQSEDENADLNQQTQNQDKTQATQSQQQFYQQPIVVQPYQPQNQYTQPQFVQPQSGQTQMQFLQPGQPQNQFLQPGQPQTQFLQPGQQQTQFLQPGQAQTQFLQPGQPQTQFLQPGQPQTQFVQSQYAEPQNQYAQPLAQPEVQYLQPQYAEPQNQYGQPQLAQPQTQFLQPQSADLQNQYLQPQFAQPQAQFGQPQPQFLQQSADIQNQYLQPQNQYQPSQQFQGQNNLQSGLDVNQEGNDIDEPEEKEEGATAVATAFGSRTQPRVNTQYGAPFPVPKVQANPTTTESAVEDITEEGPAVAQAVAVANGERRKSARLRSRRIRPVYAVDRSGRLVLAEA